MSEFHVRRRLDGTVAIHCPPTVVPPALAVEIARAILHEAGAEVVVADPSQTVIRPPGMKGNGLLR
jgi:hypothetical protein